MNHKKYIIGAIATFVIVIFGLLFFGQGESKSPSHSVITISDIDSTAINVTKTTQIKTVFGLPVGRFQKSDGVVKRNQNLSSILSKYDVSPLTIHEVAQKARPVFNVRYIRPGKKYHVYFKNDESSNPLYLVYEENPVDYVVFNLKKPSTTYAGKKHVTQLTKKTSGIIKSSLYTTLEANDADPVLTEKLAGVFAWEIDFYHLQKGDRYKIVYNEQLIDGKPIGAGKIKAAYFQHNDHDYYAFAFDQNGKTGYFDLNGNSLKKAFLKAPLKYTRISSRFSYHRYHPVLHRYLPHLGVDFAAPTGTPIHSVGDGVIEVASYNSGNGRYIKIRHNSVYETEYLHMSHFARGIHRGAHVKQGQLIGYVGSTGLATGPHLDYRIWKNGREVNPLKIDLPSSNPVKPKLHEEYNQTMALLISQLNSVIFHQPGSKTRLAADTQSESESNSTTSQTATKNVQHPTTL